MSSMTISPSYARSTYVRQVHARAPHLGPQGAVRLTRRGRLVVFLLALAAALTIGLLLSDRSTATSEAGRDVPTQVVHVGAGETLWGIASDLAEDGDVRGMVDEIEQLNALDSSMLYAGQELYVPVVD